MTLLVYYLDLYLSYLTTKEEVKLLCLNDQRQFIKDVVYVGILPGIRATLLNYQKEV